MKTHTIKLPNGSTAVSFVPEDSKELAIVPLHVLQRLSKLLPTAHPRAIINEFIAELEGINSSSGNNELEQAVNAAEEFTSFHRTVNLITAYDPNEGMPRVVGRINLDEINPGMH